jgi:biopolymer transport protein ExbD
LLEQELPLELPKGGKPERKIDEKSIRTVEIARSGAYTYNGARIQLQNLTQQLKADYQADPNLVVYIRADANGLNKYTYDVIDACQQNGITRFSLRTEPRK